MENKVKYIIIGIIGIMLLIGVVLGINTALTDGDGTNPLISAGIIKTEYTLKFYSDNSQVSSISSQVETYRTNPYMKDDLNNETINWIESFDNNEYVYLSGDVNLIMKRTDYDILKNQINTSELSTGFNPIEFFKVIIKANMKETRNLGSGYKDVAYVEGIELFSSVKDST